MLKSDIVERLHGAPADVRDLVLGWPLVWMLGLPAEANIVVAGAYRGRVMEMLAIAYPDYARLIGFEPQDEARWVARDRLDKRYSHVEIYPYALGVINGTFAMGEYGAEFAGFRNLTPAGERHAGSARLGTGDMRDAAQVFDELKLSRIDLLFLNVEGYEYLLLPHLVQHGFFDQGRIRRLVMQLHPGMPDNRGIEHHMFTAMTQVERKNKRVYDAIPNWAMWEWSYA